MRGRLWGKGHWVLGLEMDFETCVWWEVVRVPLVQFGELLDVRPCRRVLALSVGFRRHGRTSVVHSILFLFKIEVLKIKI